MLNILLINGKRIWAESWAFNLLENSYRGWEGGLMSKHIAVQMWDLNLNHQNPHRSWRQSVNTLHPSAPTERWEVGDCRIPGRAWQEGKNQLWRLFEHHTNLIVHTSAHTHRHKQEQPLSHKANSISNPILCTIDVHWIRNKYGTCTVTLSLKIRDETQRSFTTGRLLSWCSLLSQPPCSPWSGFTHSICDHLIIQ